MEHKRSEMGRISGGSDVLGRIIVSLDYEFFKTIGPPGLPKEISDYLSTRFAVLVKNKSFVSTMDKLGEDIAFIPQDEWYETIKDQYQTWGEVAKSIAEEEKAKKK